MSEDAPPTKPPVIDASRRSMFAGKRAAYLAFLACLTFGGLIVFGMFVLTLRVDLCSGMVTLAVLVFLWTKLRFRAGLGWLNRWVRKATALRWDCPRCSKRLESDIPWTCGSCDRDNATSSFLHRCGHCHAEPKALECYHCGAIIFFSAKDQDDRCIARKVPGPLPGETLAEMEARHRREIGERRHTIARLEADATIRTLEAKMKPAAEVDPKTARETWMREQVASLGFTVGAVIETIGEKKRLMERIASDTTLSDAEKTELASLVNHHCDNLSDDIRFGKAEHR